MAAVLACGPHALLSHRSAAALLGIRDERPGPIDVLVPDHVCRRQPGVRLHRRGGIGSGNVQAVGALESGTSAGIPVTSPVATLIDLAMCVSRHELEEAVNEADHLGLIDPESLRETLDAFPSRPGIARLRQLLDRDTFVLTESRLERLFLPLTRAAGLPLPQTQVWLNDYRVDFYWPDLRLVVETDGLRYHRTPAKQAADNRRNQAHIAAGLMPLRFTHWEICNDSDHVRKMLAIAARQRG
jgi:very-short-patch-repair endonuclease